MLKRLLFLLLLGAAGALVFRRYAFEGIYVASASMEPGLKTGTHVFVNKLVLLLRKPRRGEIVTFDLPLLTEKSLVKRVIAIEGDVIEIKKKKVYLNGQLLNEPYVQYLSPDTLLKGDDLPPVQVPPGYVFVMGDNRDVSGDSRDWRSADRIWTPYVPIGAIDGVVMSVN